MVFIIIFHLKTVPLFPFVFPRAYTIHSLDLLKPIKGQIMCTNENKIELNNNQAFELALLF